MKNIYILASYAKRPKNPKSTSKPGYMADEKNVSYDEKVHIATKVKDRELRTCQVILDMKNRKVIKNSFKSDKTYDDLIKYYSENYEDYFRDTLGQLIPNVESNIPAVPGKEEETIHGSAEAQPDVASEGTATN